MRTINEIITEQVQARVRLPELVALIDAEIQADASLDDLTSDSKTADYREWEYVMAACSFITEALWEEAKTELIALGEAGIAANQYWFQREWKKFQYGDALLVNDTTRKYYYAVIDPAKQIIAKLAIVRGTSNWIVKVAKLEGGVNVPLTTDELNAFKNFVDRTQPPGPKIPVFSLAGDLLDGRFTIYYNPITPLDQLKPLVEAAYNEYLAKVDLELDSVYYISKHIDALQGVPGVTDVVQVSVEAKDNGGVYAPVNRIYTPLAGYIVKDPALSFDDLLTYVAVL